MGYQIEDFIREIGHISVFFATLDFLVTALTWELVSSASTERPPFPPTATLGMKLEFLDGLRPGDVRDATVLQRVQNILPQARHAAAERNRYIHDQWVFDSTLVRQGRIKRLKLNGPTPEAVEYLTIQDMIAFRNELGELQKRFAAFR